MEQTIKGDFMTDFSAPLAGIRVLDLSTAIAGPHASGLMADQGADVIKIETPGIGDIMRYVGAQKDGVSAMFQNANRGKRSITLNLKTEAGKDIIRKLLVECDVLVHNFRIGVMEKLGLGFEQLHKEFPQLVYLSVYGYGHSGPRSSMRAYDNVVQCFAGVAKTQANIETGEPIYAFQVISDKLTALTGFQAITAALLARERQSCGGQHIQLSMVDTTVAFLWMDASGAATFLDEGAAEGASVAKGNKLMQFKNGWGCCAPLSDDEFHGVCRAFGVDSSDPKLASALDRNINIDVMIGKMAEVQEKALLVDVDEAIARMDAEDVPCSKANELADLPNEPQIQANGTFVKSVHPVAGNIQEPRPPAQFSKTSAAIQGPCPALGQHTEEILVGLGLGEELPALREQGVV